MRLAVLFVTACVALGDVAWAKAPEVLVLHSTRRDAVISLLADRDIPKLLTEEHGIDYYSEYIDEARSPDYQVAFRDFLRRKYAGQRFDLIMGLYDNAIEFLRNTRGTLFPDTPVVFLANRIPAPMPNTTGVVAASRFQDTVNFAAALQPDLQHVFVVTGASGRDRAYEAEARAQFASATSRFTFTYLSGLRTNELESTLRALPPRSMVFVLVFYQDGSGENFHPVEYTSRIAAVASAPTYSWLDAMMDHGIVGGSMLSEGAEIQAVAAVALRVLHGERADAIPTGLPDVAVKQVDWRQLQRWHISEASLPVGTVVRFKEIDTWAAFRRYIVGGAVVVLAQSLLIGGLLAQRRRRRKADQKIRDLGGRLLQAQEDERSRIARELHDDVSQEVALLSLDIDRLRKSSSNSTNDVVDRLVGRVQAVAMSVRNLSHQLHPARLQLLGLVEALKGLQHELAQSDLTIDFWHEDVPEEIRPDVALCIFRTAQEALHNALKHSKARHLTIRLRAVGGNLALTIADDGVGFDARAAWGTGLGLVSMRERLDLVGGRLRVWSRAGAGTRLTVSIPLRPPERQK